MCSVLLDHHLYCVCKFCSLKEVCCAAQMGSFFVMQGANMDRNMFGGRFVIPSASLSLFNTISIIALIPVYDRGVVPLLQKFGIKITHLQRIGESLALKACL